MRRHSSLGEPDGPLRDFSATPADVDPLAQPQHSTLNGNHERQGSLRAVPGRPRKRNPTGSSKHGKRNFCYRFYAYWIRGTVRSFSSLLLAVFLWYALGVISIGTSKILLTKHDGFHLGNVPPFFLTLQQLVIGSSLLRFLLEVRFMGSSGVQPWPSVHNTLSQTHDRRRHSLSSKKSTSPLDILDHYQPSLMLSAVFFAVGFLATNFGFAGSPASFVETIKAAEPITSATIAYLWGIELLSRQEVISLGGIVAGVLLSTIGNRHSASLSATASFSDSLRACLIVMTSNLCFSFRGLYQKLFRATPEGSTQVVDDLNLQYRMQQVGVAVLVAPVLLFEFPSICRSLWRLSMHHGLFTSGLALRYLGVSLLNGCAFTCYNLASTYILSRISVVHHAALNCIRRIFAIIVTSIVFAVPITFVGALGIVVSVVGFLAFSHYKVQRQTQPKPLSSLLPISAIKS